MEKNITKTVYNELFTIMITKNKKIN